MIEAYKTFLRNYANFNGRSNRADYWWVVLCNIIIGFIIGFVCGLVGGDNSQSLALTISGIYELAVLIPGLALYVRRLHDINKSGWHIFMGLIPVVGGIILLVYAIKDSVNEGNNYGERVQ